MHNDFANFSTFFSSQVCNIPPIHVAALSRLCPQPTAHRRCATPPVAEPDRALQTTSPIAVMAEPDRALRTSSSLAVVRNPTARAVTPSANPRQRRGHTHRRRCAADAPPLRLYSGTALRCISSSPLYPRTRCPGLTENGSALRTAPPSLP